jgi:hypothetical protein
MLRMMSILYINCGAGCQECISKATRKRGVMTYCHSMLIIVIIGALTVLVLRRWKK